MAEWSQIKEREWRGGRPTADEDGEGSRGQGDDEGRAGEQRVDDPADALADDGLPNICAGRTHTEETQEEALINVHGCGCLFCSAAANLIHSGCLIPGRVNKHSVLYNTASNGHF